MGRDTLHYPKLLQPGLEMDPVLNVFLLAVDLLQFPAFCVQPGWRLGCAPALPEHCQAPLGLGWAGSSAGKANSISSVV